MQVKGFYILVKNNTTVLRCKIKDFMNPFTENPLNAPSQSSSTSIVTIVFVTLLIFVILVALVIACKYYIRILKERQLFLNNTDIPTIVGSLSGIDFEIWTKQLFERAGGRA